MNDYRIRILEFILSFIDFTSSIMDFVLSIFSEILKFIVSIFSEILKFIASLYRYSIQAFVFFLLAIPLILFFILAVTPPIKPFIIYIVLFLTSLGIIYFLLLGVFKLISVLIKAIFQTVIKEKSKNNFINIIALGITTFFFSVTGNSFINSFLSFTIRFTYKVIERLIEHGRSINIGCPRNNITIEQLVWEGDSWLKYIDHISNFFHSDCFSNILLRIIEIWQFSFVEAYNLSKINYLPFLNIIFFVSSWLILTKIIEFLFEFKINRNIDYEVVKENFKKISLLIINYIKKTEFIVKDPTRSNIIFFLILGTGLYLSIATIAAIPTLEDTNTIPEELTPENLEKDINELLINFLNDFPDENNNNYFSKIREESPLAINIGEENKNEYDIEIQKINNKISELEKTREIEYQKNNALRAKLEINSENYYEKLDELNNQLNSAIYSIERQKESERENRELEFNKKDNYRTISSTLKKIIENRIDLIDKAKNMYLSSHGEVELSARNVIKQYTYSTSIRKGNRETQEHSLALNNWFGDVRNKFATHISVCQESINNLDKDLENIDQTRYEYLVDFLIENNSYEFNREFNSFIAPIEDSLNKASLRCSPLDIKTIPEIPSRQDLGEYLGLFSIVASWLLKTESLPLTLITGLLGFGLLGSACSSFVRENIASEVQEENRDKRNSPLVKDLSKVIIIGLSAAILVFLAVMGGLAVLFSTSSTPNPYGLLLVCLISAVFGEDIWRTARRRLEENLDSSNASETEISTSVEAEVVTKEKNINKKRKRRNRK